MNNTNYWMLAIARLWVDGKPLRLTYTALNARQDLERAHPHDGHGRSLHRLERQAGAAVPVVELISVEDAQANASTRSGLAERQAGCGVGPTTKRPETLRQPTR